MKNKDMIAKFIELCQELGIYDLTKISIETEQLVKENSHSHITHYTQYTIALKQDRCEDGIDERCYISFVIGQTYADYNDSNFFMQIVGQGELLYNFDSLVTFNNMGIYTRAYPAHESRILYIRGSNKLRDDEIFRVPFIMLEPIILGLVELILYIANRNRIG